MSIDHASHTTPPKKRALRCATAGSVDDGKSTLLGRLLFDAKAIMTDQLEHVEEASRRRGLARTDLALVTDGLRAEREQGITIDVAWRYFATPARRFILADAPGHVQYTRNMVTAASRADVAIVLVDVRHGLVEQTRRHLFVTRLLAVRSIAVVVNKMDQVGYAYDVFARVREDIATYLRGLDGLFDGGAPPEVTFFPVSALVGDNVVDRSAHTPWYDGPTLLAHLEGLDVEEEAARAPARFAVQWVIRPQTDALPDYRGYAGRVLSGALRLGDRVTVWPSGLTSTVTRIETMGADLDVAPAGASVTLHLADDLDVGRGDLVTVDGEPAPTLARELEADVAWVHASQAKVGVPYLLKHGTREVRAMIGAIVHQYDVATGAHAAPGSGGLQMNGIARVSLRTSEPLPLDAFARQKETGSFLLIDPASGATLAAGMVR
jgi:sulfate adenylyltransferase subunit 1